MLASATCSTPRTRREARGNFANLLWKRRVAHARAIIEANGRRDERGRVESEIERSHVRQASHEEQCSDEEKDRERRLRHDESRANSRMLNNVRPEPILSALVSSGFAD